MTLAIIITARPSYARIKSAITALVNRGVEVHLIVCASALLERYGKVVDVIRKDFPDVPVVEIFSTYEGATLQTSAKETAALGGELAGVLSRLRPSAAVVIADRHEVLGAAQAVAYQHIPLIHVQGGERTGSIDDKVRDSITQLADVHLVATSRAKHRVYGLTGEWESIHVTGCPSIDLAKQALSEPLVTREELGGSGAALTLRQPFVVVLQHPVTSEAAAAGEQMRVTLEAVSRVSLPRLVFWPGEDAGADAMSKTLRSWIADHREQSWHTVRNVAPVRFLKLLTQAAVLVGNSSVGIRECAYLGVPAVNIGSRQCGRERARNVIDTPHDRDSVADAIEFQVAHGPYASSSLYGSGDAGEKIAEVLCRG